MLNRKNFGKLEEKNLAPYACKSNKSSGRKYFEKEDVFRTCFQRDRDRIIHSQAFRRLKHKTQVFVAPEGDHFRTRLTHTLEATQIARHLARLLKLNEDLVEAISLAHDLGHTPFGHAGEETLNELMKDYGGFEHNHQSRRIVEELENRYPNFSGLNLTFEVREGLVKHQTPWDSPNGIFEGSPSLEAQIVNIADEIAYNNHDLDDGLTAGLLKFEDLKKNIELWQEAMCNVQNYLKESFHHIEKEKINFLGIRYLINQQIIDLASESEKNILKLKINNLSAVYKSKKPLISFSNKMSRKNKQMRNYLKENFYLNPLILKRNENAQKKLKAIFLGYLNQKLELPKTIKRNIETGVFLPQAVCDYVAGMTDNFALKTYGDL